MDNLRGAPPPAHGKSSANEIVFKDVFVLLVIIAFTRLSLSLCFIGSPPLSAPYGGSAMFPVRPGGQLPSRTASRSPASFNRGRRSRSRDRFNSRRDGWGGPAGRGERRDSLSPGRRSAFDRPPRGRWDNRRATSPKVPLGRDALPDPCHLGGPPSRRFGNGAKSPRRLRGSPSPLRRRDERNRQQVEPRGSSVESNFQHVVNGDGRNYQKAQSIQTSVNGRW